MMEAASFLAWEMVDMAKIVRNLTGIEAARAMKRQSAHRRVLPNVFPSKEPNGTNRSIGDHERISIPMSLLRFRTGSPRRRIVILIDSPITVGSTITDDAIIIVDARLSPERGRPMMTGSRANVMKAETTSGVGGKPILLMKLNASMVPDTPWDFWAGRAICLGAT